MRYRNLFLKITQGDFVSDVSIKQSYNFNVSFFHANPQAQKNYQKASS